MSTVKRRLFNVLAAVSLVLCMATAAMWVRSEWYGDRMDCNFAGTCRLSIETVPGGISSLLDVLWDDPNPPPRSIGLNSTRWGSPVYTRPGSIMGRRQIGTVQPWILPWVHHGFAAWHKQWSSTHAQYAIALPLWFVVLVTLVLPLLATRAAIRRHRNARRGRCARCGYDLRATPERCPECGSAVKPAA